MENAPLAETIRKILNEELSRMRDVPSSDLRIIQIAMEDLKNSQAEMKRELSDIKRKLLDPDDGVIVKVNENTRFRAEFERKQEREDIAYQKMVLEHSDLVKWKSGVNKALWIFFTTLVGILAKIFFLSESH
jgi:hypothetical protein